MSPRTYFSAFVALLIMAAFLAGAASLAFAAPAHAADRVTIVGHRCITAVNHRNNVENSLTALRKMRPGTWCEIDVWPTASEQGDTNKGPLVVVHDERWRDRPIYKEATLEGVQSRIPDTKTSEALQVRTRGGGNVVTYSKFAKIAAREGIKLLVETKYVPRPDEVDRIEKRTGVQAVYYNNLYGSGCTNSGNTQRLRDIGYRIGVKSNRGKGKQSSDCPPQPWSLGFYDRRDASVVAYLRASYFTANRVRNARQRGIMLVSHQGPAAVKNGARAIITDRPNSKWAKRISR